MGTRSDIIVQRADGKWARIYCHWDGYLEHNGKILAESYADQAKAEELVSHGDLSSLAHHCSKPPGHTFDKRVEGYCVYYGRDRGESGTEPKIGATLEAVWPAAGSWTEFTYVKPFEKPWLLGNPDESGGTLTPLSDAMAGKVKKTFPVKAFGMTIGKHHIGA